METTAMTTWIQECIRLPAYPRGFHLVTREIERRIERLDEIKIGVANLFILHTSASLTLNENADPTVRGDFERHFNVMIPEGATYYRHTYEGADDMPAHLKASVLGASLTIPVRDGRFLLGTWQGVYLCEHRDHASGRQLAITVHGAAETAE